MRSCTVHWSWRDRVGLRAGQRTKVCVGEFVGTARAAADERMQRDACKEVDCCMSVGVRQGCGRCRQGNCRAHIQFPERYSTSAGLVCEHGEHGGVGHGLC